MNKKENYLENLAGDLPIDFNERCSEISEDRFDNLPKYWEKEKKIYEFLGVRQFKKLYNYTLGKLVNKLDDIYQGGIDRTNLRLNDKTKKGFDKAINSTIELEIIHAFGTVVISFEGGIEYIQGNIGSALLIGVGLNTLINFYPIMLQEYNRIKLRNLKNKFYGEEK